MKKFVFPKIQLSNCSFCPPAHELLDIQAISTVQYHRVHVFFPYKAYKKPKKKEFFLDKLKKKTQF